MNFICPKKSDSSPDLQTICNAFRSFRLKVIQTMFDLQSRKSEFCNGMRLCDIINDMRTKCSCDGDLTTQVTTCLKQLHCMGILSRSKSSQRYKLIGAAARVLDCPDSCRCTQINRVMKKFWTNVKRDEDCVCDAGGKTSISNFLVKNTDSEIIVKDGVLDTESEEGKDGGNGSGNSKKCKGGRKKGRCRICRRKSKKSKNRKECSCCKKKKLKKCEGDGCSGDDESFCIEKTALDSSSSGDINLLGSRCSDDCINYDSDESEVGQKNCESRSYTQESRHCEDPPPEASPSSGSCSTSSLRSGCDKPGKEINVIHTHTKINPPHSSSSCNMNIVTKSGDSVGLSRSRSLIKIKSRMIGCNCRCHRLKKNSMHDVACSAMELTSASCSNCRRRSRSKTMKPKIRRKTRSKSNRSVSRYGRQRKRRRREWNHSKHSSRGDVSKRRKLCY